MSTAPAPLAELGRAPLTSDRLVALDAGVVLAVTLAILTWAERWGVMSAVVAAALVVRFGLWAWVPRAERGLSLAAEIGLFAGLGFLGAFNDWNSVCRHGIYEYRVPVDAPAWSSIPTWMLVYWGQILRLMVTVARWHRLGPPARPDDRVWLAGRPVRSAALRVGVAFGLVLVTRQAIYRLWDDPVLSWLPFAGALALAGWLLRPGAHAARLVAIVVVVGPLVEAAYISVGLHRYALGWFGGVPLWIVLWWGLGMVVLSDLVPRVLAMLADAPAGAPDRAEAALGRARAVTPG